MAATKGCSHLGQSLTMSNYFFYSVSLMSFFLTSCNQKPEIDVSVTNNSGTSIDSIWVSIAGKLQRFTKPVPVHGKGKLVIDFSKVGKNDGLIMFGFFLHNGGKRDYDEYYSNGGMPRGHYNFEVLSDTVKLKAGGFFQ